MTDIKNPINNVEILPDTSLKINGTPVEANIISIKPSALRGLFVVELQMRVMLTAAPPAFDVKELEETGQFLIKSQKI